MDSRIVNREIRSCIWPRLRTAGFSRFNSRTAWRHAEHHIDVLNFQSFNSYNAGVLGVSTFSFAVNLGTRLRYVPSQYQIKQKEGIPFPAEYNCEIRGRLQRTLLQADNPHKDIWSIDPNGDNLAWCIGDVELQLPDALLWFNFNHQREDVLQMLLFSDEDMSTRWGFGRNPSPARSYLTGYVARSLGMETLAAEKLNEAVVSGCSKQQFATINEALQLTP